MEGQQRASLAAAAAYARQHMLRWSAPQLLELCPSTECLMTMISGRCHALAGMLVGGWLIVGLCCCA